MRITGIRSLLHHPARLTLIEVHTDAGIVGLGIHGVASRHDRSRSSTIPVTVCGCW